MKLPLPLPIPNATCQVALLAAMLLSGLSSGQTPAPAEAPAAPAPLSIPKEPTAAAAPATTVAPVTAASPGEIRLNFQGASLVDVLNYLSEAAGFVIVQEVPVTGTVSVISRQPVSADEAVDLLNAVLVEKGYAAIRNGRILKIVSRKDAQKRDLPVQMGSDPGQIPRKDDIVTQILPLHYGEAAKLVENLRPLLSETASISANESSNAIILTDTQANIRRIAQIIQAIDTSVSSISTIKVFPLQFADSKGLATVLTQLFATSATTDQTRGGGRGRGGFGGFGFGQGGAPEAAPQSEARQAASRVVAVADEQSNSLIVSAPDEVIPTIAEIVKKIDTSVSDATETRIFRLEHGDATEIAEILNNLYTNSTPQTAQAQNQGRNNRGGWPGGRGGQPAATAATQESQRALQQAKVVAVGDPRTNSLLVNAGRETMTQIAMMIGRLDATDAKRQHVYIHYLQHADPDSVAAVLRGMLGDTSATNSANASGASRLTERSATGASTDTTQSSTSSTGRSTR